MTHISGWCGGPPGARPDCGGCKVPGCEHDCHETRMVERESRSEVRQIEGRMWENKDGPNRAVSATQPGPDRLHLAKKGGG